MRGGREGGRELTNICGAPSGQTERKEEKKAICKELRVQKKSGKEVLVGGRVLPVYLLVCGRRVLGAALSREEDGDESGQNVNKTSRHSGQLCSGVTKCDQAYN